MSVTEPAGDKKSKTSGIRKLVLVLLILSVAGVSGRALLFDKLQLADGVSLWRVLVDVQIDAEKNAVLQLSPPKESATLRLMQQSMWHPEFSIRNTKNDQERSRTILAFTKNSGRSNISFEFTLMMLPSANDKAPTRTHRLSAVAEKRYLANREELKVDNRLVRTTARQLVSGITETDKQADAIFRYLRQLPRNLSRDTMSPVKVLEKRKATSLDRVLTMVALCRATGIPSRVVTGIELQEESAVRVLRWVQVYTQTGWRSYDFNSGSTGTLPASYLAMKNDDISFIRINEGKLVKLDLGVERDLAHPLLKREDIRHYLNIFDLTRLPKEKQADLALLLLLPFGALVTALCRHLVGLHSYGVFTPTLLALALVYTDIVSTLGILLVICALAIAGRSIFPDNISRVPRLSIIFTLVAVILSLLVSTLDYFGLQQNGKVILLPVIILTSLIDRLYRTIEDKGLGIAMRRLAWTIFITLLCLPVIQFEQLGYLMLHYPETHLATLALFLLVSTYKGKQLINLPVIRLLSEPDTPKNTPKKKPREEYREAD